MHLPHIYICPISLTFTCTINKLGVDFVANALLSEYPCTPCYQIHHCPISFHKLWGIYFDSDFGWWKRRINPFFRSLLWSVSLGVRYREESLCSSLIHIMLPGEDFFFLWNVYYVLPSSDVMKRFRTGSRCNLRINKFSLWKGFAFLQSECRCTRPQRCHCHRNKWCVCKTDLADAPRTSIDARATNCEGLCIATNDNGRRLRFAPKMTGELVFASVNRVPTSVWWCSQADGDNGEGRVMVAPRTMKSVTTIEQVAGVHVLNTSSTSHCPPSPSCASSLSLAFCTACGQEIVSVVVSCGRSRV